MNYCVLVCPKCGATDWKSEIRPSVTKKGINLVELVCAVCGYITLVAKT